MTPRKTALTRALMPRRRRRLWRYVSPRRRGAGMAVLAMLLAAIYLYWHMTNGRRVRALAEQTLTDLTGGQVKVDRASFSLFGGIQLDNVRLLIPGQGSPLPFFSAQRVVLRHRPWSIFLTGQLDPTEIICLRPTVNLEYDVEAQTSNAARLAKLAARRRDEPGPALTDELIPIRMRESVFRVWQVADGERRFQREWPLGVLILADEDRIVIRFEEQEVDIGGLQGRLTLNAETGAVEEIQGFVPLERIDKALPPRYRQWLARYGIRGQLEAEYLAGNEAFGITMRGLSISLPLGDASLNLAGVTGDLRLAEDGVTLTDVAGTLPQAGHAPFTLAGRYEGYDPNAPFSLSLDVRRMSLPARLEGTGTVDRALQRVHEVARPGGTMHVELTARREPNGPLTVRGVARPGGMSVLPRPFPYPVSDIRGEIHFDHEGIRRFDLLGRNGPASIRAAGTLTQDDAGDIGYDVTVDAVDLAIDETFSQAAPDDLAATVRLLGLSGRAGLRMHVTQPPGGLQRLYAVADPNGTTSLVHEMFPYPLHQLTGRIVYDNGTLTIEDVRGRNGPGRARINGTITDLDSADANAPLHVTVRAANAPIDQTLHDALPPRSAGFLRDLNVSAGRVVEANAVFTGTTLRLGEWHAEVRLDELDFRPAVFPYAIHDANGMLRLSEGRIGIAGLAGRHGRTRIDLAGLLHTDRDPPGAELTIDADDLQFDTDLRLALPAELEGLWRKLRPGGVAEGSLTYRADLPGMEPNTVDYRLRLDANEMSVTYHRLPYRLTGVRGRILATPEEVTLEGITAREGDARVEMAGTIPLGDANRPARLSLSGRALPLDERLLSLLPDEMAGLTRQIRPGGSLDLLFDELVFQAPDPLAPLEEDESPADPITPDSPAEPDAIESPPPPAGSTASGRPRDDRAARGASGSAADPAGRPPAGATRARFDPPLTAPDPRVPSGPQPVRAGESAPPDPDEPAGPTIPGVRPGDSPGVQDPGGSVGAGAPGSTGATPPEPQPTGVAAPWQARGRIVLHDVALDLGFGPKTLSGEIVGTTGRDANGVAIDAALSVEALDVGGPRITDLTGRVRKSPARPVVTLADLGGKAHGGWVTGKAELHLAAPTRYAMELSVRDLDLAKLIQAGQQDANASEDLAGKISGRLHLLDTPSRRRARQAAGTIRITDGKIVRMPILLGLLHVLQLTLPGDSVFNAGEVTYHLRGDRLLLRPISLTGTVGDTGIGSAVAATGSGVIDIRTGRMKLSFLTGPAGKVPDLAELGKLIEPLLQELVVTEVTGTVSHPQIRAVPLRGLDTFLRRLLNPALEE